MAQTQIPFGHPLAKKVFGAALFAEVVQKPGFTKNMTGPAPSAAEAKSKLEKMQTSPRFPFVRVNDLSKGAGDTVSVDLFNILQGKPTMGDKTLEGRLMSLTSSSQDVKIDQIRAGVDTGGRMTQQRTVHDLRTIGMAGLAGWWTRYLDQIKLITAAGQRGFQNDPSWVIPLESDPDFSDIVTNGLKPATKNRTFFGGDAVDIANMDAADILTLDTVDKLRAAIDEMDVPLQPVQLPDESDENAFWVLMLSPRQWHYLINRTGATAVRTFQQNAQIRGSKNPLFAGEVGMWNGILIKKMPRAIRFPAGQSVTLVSNDTTLATTSETVPAFGGATGAGVDLGILFGAQAVAEVFGRDSASGTHMNWHEQMADHDNRHEASVRAIGGFDKLRFKKSDGENFDHGVAVVYSYAPDPRSVTIA